MKNLKIIVAVGLVGLGAVAWGDTKTTYRDASGRVQGAETTDRYGKTTYRDASGRVQGLKRQIAMGIPHYRDSHGRVQGTKK